MDAQCARADVMNFETRHKAMRCEMLRWKTGVIFFKLLVCSNEKVANVHNKSISTVDLTFFKKRRGGGVLIM